MFQTFENPSNPTLARDRVASLRARFDALGIDAFLVPRADEHQGEYVPASAERLRWLTGFSGSAGAALIMRDRAILFVDGRYRTQVRIETDGSLFDYENLIERPPARWLAEHGRRDLRLGIDPWLHTVRETETIRKAMDEIGGSLVVLAGNPVDTAWADRPEPPLGKIIPHPVRFAGVAAKRKLDDLAQQLKDKKVGHFVLSDPSSIAWAFNIRGEDVPHTPLPLAFAILAADGRHAIHADARKIPPRTRSHLEKLCRIRPPKRLEADLARISRASARIGMDPHGAPERLRMIVEEGGGTVVPLGDPVALPRATKNRAEIAGARAAHRRDGAAMSRFLFWLDQQAPATVDEISAARTLEDFRRALGDETQMPLKDIAFDTISGAGPNGAIVHYRVNTATNRRLEPGSLYLVDSGGQYADGTTDITRTVAIGEPTQAMRRHYTIVLKGLIAISVLRFPAGTRGMDIDAVARLAHWRAGLDYAHGTGHGVGSFLSVHEGPQRISRAGTEKLLAGMILSNEPGYYREGEYGIRLENLVLVTPAETVEGGEIDMHGFETLTLVPFDRPLVDTQMLGREERAWLDAYHQRVASEIGPLLDDRERRWLERQCRPI